MVMPKGRWCRERLCVCVCVRVRVCACVYPFLESVLAVEDEGAVKGWPHV